MLDPTEVVALDVGRSAFGAVRVAERAFHGFS